MRRRRGVLAGRPIDIALLSDPSELEEARDCHLALALEGAGPGPWRTLGFRPLPASETACRTVLPAAWPREPSWIAAGEEPEAGIPGLRPFLPSDLDAVMDIHAQDVQGQVFRIDRDRRDWERVLEEFRPPAVPGEERAPFWVIERQGRIEGYAVLEAGSPTLRWREHGARRDAEGAAVDLFWGALAWARRRSVARIEGWWMPGALTLGPIYPASDRRRKDRVPVVLPLVRDLPTLDFAREEDCRICEIDVLGDQ